MLLAALGPQMLALAGSRTAGTVTWMTGPKTIGSHIVPTISDAAHKAGRPAPRIAALVPIHITDDTRGARLAAAEKLALYGQLPSYRHMLDREGFDGPADAALIGNEAFVREQIGAYAAAGVTDLGLAILAGDADRDRTRELIASL